MSRKINPISFRLGLSQVWNGPFQLYSKNFCFYSNLFHSKVFLENYIRRLFVGQGFLLDSIHWYSKKKSTILLIMYKDLLNFPLLKAESLHDLIHSLWNLNLKVYLIKKLNWTNSAVLLNNYIANGLEKKFNFKKSLKDIIILIRSQLGTKKIVYTNKGPASLTLTGFKFTISGRLDNARNQMSKKSSQVEGSLPLSQLYSYIEYHSSVIHTKSGANNLQIWLFYIL